MSEVSLDDPRWRTFTTQVEADRRAAGARVDASIAAFVAQQVKVEGTRQKMPQSSWITPGVIAAWRERQPHSVRVGL